MRIVIWASFLWLAGAPGTAYAESDGALREALGAAGIATPTWTKPAKPLVDLGKALFYDKVLSGTKRIACATCHHPTEATGDGLPVPIGEGGLGLGPNRLIAYGRFIPRNAPAIFNLGVDDATTLFWDGRVRRDPATGALETPEPALNGTHPARPDIAGALDSALAAQAMFPVTSRDEMRGQPGTSEIADAKDNLEVWDRLMKRLGAIPAYRDLFAAAFPATSFASLTFGHAAKAIAAFEIAAWTELETPLDKFLSGSNGALTKQQKAGARVFVGNGKCVACHGGPLLTDLGFHALGAPQLGPGKDGGDDRGLALLTGNASDAYQFRTPPLRNVCLTGPWTHAGAFSTIEAVLRHHADPEASLRHYDPAQIARQDLRESVDTDPGRLEARAKAIDPALKDGLSLTDAELSDLTAFLCGGLTDKRATDPYDPLPKPPRSVPSGLPVTD